MKHSKPIPNYSEPIHTVHHMLYIYPELPSGRIILFCSPRDHTNMNPIQDSLPSKDVDHEPLTEFELEDAVPPSKVEVPLVKPHVAPSAGEDCPAPVPVVKRLFAAPYMEDWADLAEADHCTPDMGKEELLDEALSVLLPDKKRRLEMLQAHTYKLKKFFAADVNLAELATRAELYDDADFGAVVRSAGSFSLSRDLWNVIVTMDDFQRAFQEVPPFCGEELEQCRFHGMLNCGDPHRHVFDSAMRLVENVKSSETPLGKCLLKGPCGTGKSALAATIAIRSRFPFVRIISPGSMISLYDEGEKCVFIEKVFEEAYRSQLSIIILDDVPKLIGYIPLGPRFSNKIYQTLCVLLKRIPPKGSKLLVIGTSSEFTSSQSEFLDSLFCDLFSNTYSVPTLTSEDAKKVLEQLNVFADEDINAAADALNHIPIQQLFTSIGVVGRSAKMSGKKKIDITEFCDWLRVCGLLGDSDSTAILSD